MRHQTKPSQCPKRPRPLLLAAVLASAGALLLPNLAPAHAALYITTDNTVANGNPINSNLSGNSVFVGLAFDGTSVPGVHVDVVDPANLGVNVFTGGGLSGFSDSRINVLGGYVGSLGAGANSTVTVTGGTLGGVGTSGSGTMILSGGSISTSGGAIGAYAYAGSMTINSGTSISSSFAVFSNGGDVTINGGLLGVASPPPSTNAYGVHMGAGSLILRGGTLRNGLSTNSLIAALVSGGEVTGGLLADFGAGMNITGGVFSGSVISERNSLFDIRGGAFSNGDFQAYGGSARISGGTYGSTFALLGSGTIDFFGDGLTLTSLGGGNYSNPNTYYGASNFTGEYYRLTGTLQDGQSIDRTLFRATGATGAFHLNATAVPEPGTLCLVGALMPAAGAFVPLRRRRRKQAGQR